jgi:hypothetical protein
MIPRARFRRPRPFVAALLGVGLVGAGQGPGASGLSAQESLQAVSAGFAAGWGGGDLQRVGDLLRPAGLRLDLTGHRAGQVSVRQAVAALGDFHQDHESVEARVNRVEETGGSPTRGFAEIAWTAVPSGTSEARTYVIFASFVREDEAWLISEIRVLR